MENVSRIYLDTNVLIMLGEGGGRIVHLLYDLIGSQKPSDAPFLCTSEFSLTELLVQPLRNRDEGLIRL
jgi:hypothetical protein